MRVDRAVIGKSTVNCHRCGLVKSNMKITIHTGYTPQLWSRWPYLMFKLCNSCAEIVLNEMNINLTSTYREIEKEVQTENIKKLIQIHEKIKKEDEEGDVNIHAII